MPKDNIERAVAKGTGADAMPTPIENVLYEGYGPGGVAILVEAPTDNRNRTGSEVRAHVHQARRQPGRAGLGRLDLREEGRAGRGRGAATRRTTCCRRSTPAPRTWCIDGDIWEIVTGPAELQAVRDALAAAGVEIAVRRAGPCGRPRARPSSEARARTLMRPDRGARGQRRRTGRARQLRRGRRGARAGGGGLGMARFGTAVFWIFAGTMHFVIPRSHQAIVPPPIAKWKREVVVVSGLAEIAGGVGVLPERTRRGARWWLLATLAAVYPANIHMAVNSNASSASGTRPVGPAAGAVPVRVDDLARHALTGRRRGRRPPARAESLALVIVLGIDPGHREHGLRGGGLARQHARGARRRRDRDARRRAARAAAGARSTRACAT